MCNYVLWSFIWRYLTFILTQLDVYGIIIDGHQMEHEDVEHVGLLWVPCPVSSSLRRCTRLISCDQEEAECLCHYHQLGRLVLHGCTPHLNWFPAKKNPKKPKTTQRSLKSPVFSPFSPLHFSVRGEKYSSFFLYCQVIVWSPPVKSLVPALTP